MIKWQPFWKSRWRPSLIPGILPSKFFLFFGTYLRYQDRCITIIIEIPRDPTVPQTIKKIRVALESRTLIWVPLLLTISLKKIFQFYSRYYLGLSSSLFCSDMFLSAVSFPSSGKDRPGERIFTMRLGWSPRLFTCNVAVAQIWDTL